jgi:hypothetical protein
MFGPLTKLFNAMTALAQSLTELAGTVSEANQNLRHRLYLDAPPETGLLAHQPQDGPGAPDTAAGSPERPRGRRKAA